MALGQNLVALVNIKIAGKWVFIPLTLTIVGFDTYPFISWKTSNTQNMNYEHGKPRKCHGYQIELHRFFQYMIDLLNLRMRMRTFN